MSSSSPLNDKILSLVASQSVTSLRPLNQQIAKSHPFSPVGTISLPSCPVHHVWMTKFWAWWLLNRLRPCDLWTDWLLKWKNNQRVKNLPCSLWLTGRVHEEECDESFSVFRLMTKNCARFFNWKENGKKEMIKREIATLEKALEKVI